MVYFLAAYSMLLVAVIVALAWRYGTHIDLLKEENKGLRSDKTSLENTIAEQNKSSASRISELENDLMETGIAIGDHETKNRDLEKEIQLLRDSLHRSNEESDHLNKKLNDVVSRMETIRNCVEHPY